MPQDPFAQWRVKTAEPPPNAPGVDDPFAQWRVAAPKSAPASQPERTWGETAIETAKGIGKGAARSVVGTLDLAAGTHMFPGMADSLALVRPTIDAYTTPENTPQEVGGYLETAAELAVPANALRKIGVAAARKAAPMAVPAAKAAGGVALDVATGHPLRAAGKVLGFILDAAKPAAKKVAAEAPAVVKPTPAYTGTSMTPVKMPNGSFSMPAPRPVAPAAVTAPPGRVVPPETPSINTALRDALEEIRTAAPMPPVELPPPVTLPAGYVPRATVPKPKPVKMAGPETAAPPQAEPPAPKKRAYFLKSEEELAAARAPRTETPKPSGEIRIEDLPESWQSRIDQDLFPLTGAEGEAVAAELAQELTARGLSRSEALMAVSKNKDLPTKTKQQLMRALSRAKGK